MAGFDDIAKKATEFLKSDKAKDALRSEKAEGVSDKLLDGVAGFANKVTGGKHEDKIADLRAKADGAIGPDSGTDPETGGVGPDGTRRP